MYGDFTELLKEDYYPQRDLLLDLQKKLGFTFHVDTTMKEFKDAFGADDGFAKFSDDYKEMFYCEMIDDAKQRKKEAERRKKHAIDDYCEYLDYKFYKKIGTITWPDAREILATHSIYKALDDEKLAEELFMDYKNSAAEKAIVVCTYFID